MTHEVVESYQYRGLAYGAVRSASDPERVYFVMLKRSGWCGCTCASWAFRGDACAHVRVFAKSISAESLLRELEESND